ncbi:hypothetical protein ADL35_12450 [Streptomyces sp. NRRL WC-3753]|nr:hypothetical protein ADL35_12450 [Streptomyces sp. NRRL WC-3753]
MTREERRAYIRRVVDDAAPLDSEDADRLRALIPMGARTEAELAAAAPRKRRPAARRKAA